MKLNQKIRYGVGCLYELSKQYPHYLDAHRIAVHQRIPVAFAHKILQTLARGGYVFAQKGLGYRLARPLSDITAFEIIALFTKDIDPNPSNPDLGVRLEKRIDQALTSFTLHDLIKQ